MNQKEFIAFLGRLCEAVGSQAEIARRAGISPQKLNDVLSNRRDPPEHLLRALSFKKEYVRDFTGRMLIQNKILEVSFDLKDKNWVMTYG